MAILLKNGAVFLHIPKTGGNWVTKVLQESQLSLYRFSHKHADLEHYHQTNATWLDSVKSLHRRVRFGAGKPFLYCFVRHPLQWYESWFKYMSQPGRDWLLWREQNCDYGWHPNAPLDGTGDEDFNQFVRNCIEKEPGFVSRLYDRYVDDEIDFVGKQENLREDLITALKRMNLEFDEEFIRNYQNYGVSKPPRKRVDWDPELKEEVLRLERPALERFGYDADARRDARVA